MTPGIQSPTPQGAERGSFLSPETDDEVVIQFEQGNQDSPVWTGQIYSGDTSAPAGGAKGFGRATAGTADASRNPPSP